MKVEKLPASYNPTRIILENHEDYLKLYGVLQEYLIRFSPGCDVYNYNFARELFKELAENG